MIEIVPMAEEHINGVVTLEEATFSIPWTRADFEREVRENTMAIYYVALMDGRVVGYAGMWHVVTEGHITNVGVLEEVRCEGIGSMLMEKLIEKALEKEMTGITLEVRMGNRPAPALYHKYGFKAELLPRHQGGCNYHVEIFPRCRGRVPLTERKRKNRNAEM